MLLSQQCDTTNGAQHFRYFVPAKNLNLSLRYKQELWYNQSDYTNDARPKKDVFCLGGKPPPHMKTSSLSGVENLHVGELTWTVGCYIDLRV